MPKGLFAGNIIHGYKILEDFKVAGGMSKISFAQKAGKEYFIKEFLYPKYPTDDSPGSEKIKAQKRKACEEFENQQKNLNSRIATRVAEGGNFVMTIDFFRDGPLYYKVTERVDTSSISCRDVANLPLKELIILVRSVCNSIRILHDLKIVHGDLKPDNILLKKTAIGYSGKLIDFDNSYFEKCPPTDREEFVGTPDYYSPEADDYVKDEDEEISGETLTLKSDIFTLGIIICEYFTGEKPIVPEDCSRVCDCVKKRKEFRFAKSLPKQVELTIRKMLSLNPNDRPNIKEVFDSFPLDTSLLLTEDSSRKASTGLKGALIDLFKRGSKSRSKPTDIPHSTDLTGKRSIDTAPPKTSSRLRGDGLKIANKRS